MPVPLVCHQGLLNLCQIIYPRQLHLLLLHILDVNRQGTHYVLLHSIWNQNKMIVFYIFWSDWLLGNHLHGEWIWECFDRKTTSYVEFGNNVSSIFELYQCRASNGKGQAIYHWCNMLIIRLWLNFVQMFRKLVQPI